MTDVATLYDALSPDDREAVDALLAADVAAVPWRPLLDLEDPERRTPQQAAFESKADILLYGGAAGGGKSDLLCGLAVTDHRRSLILRREAKQLAPIIDRLSQILRTRDGWNGQRGRWTLPHGRLIDLGGVKDPGDEMAYQGAPHDGLFFDECAQFTEKMFRYLLTWNRSTTASQRCRVVACSNPPSTAEGRWLVEFWAPWLDPAHPNPAAPGELRWFVMTADGDREVDGPKPVTIDGEELVPRSRSFIPSAVDDNPFLARTGYKAVLQALPEPLRSQMLQGDFMAGGEDDPWQVIPSEWIRLSQERWQETPRPKAKLDAMGCDPSRGGRDETVLARRFGDWIDTLIVLPGQEVPDGPAVAALVVQNIRDGAPVFVDVIGIGSSVVDHLKDNGVNVTGVHGAEAGHGRDKSGKLGFVNKRAELYWRLREALEPDNLHAIVLPPDTRLLADLAAPRWRLTPRGVQVESKVDIVKRLGRSTDRGDAVAYALMEGRRLSDRRRPVQPRGRRFSFGPAAERQPEPWR